jgi:hypothetical protein
MERAARRAERHSNEEAVCSWNALAKRDVMPVGAVRLANPDQSRPAGEAVSSSTRTPPF